MDVRSGSASLCCDTLLVAPLFPGEVICAVTTEFALAEAELQPDELRLIAPAVRRRRLEFAAGRQCAHAALRALGAPPGPLLSNEHRVPLWPTGIVGSIAHTPEVAAAAAARRSDLGGIGLDVERRNAVEEALRERICTPSELEHHRALPHSPGVDWPTLCFSAKESFFKCYFPVARTMLGFSEVEIEFGEGTFSARIVNPARKNVFEAGSHQGRWRANGEWLATGYVWRP